MKTLKDLFAHEIQDIYSAEKQLKAAFPEFIDATDDNNLTNLLEKYQEQTNSQFDKIRKIADDLDINPGNSKCEAMESLIKEAKGLLKHDMTKNVKDAGIIARVQRIMHYEISAYGTAVRYAKELDMSAIASKLQDSLDDKYTLDEKLGKMAIRRINEEAMA
jgi:ferritin-like metal-binding protein YciE